MDELSIEQSERILAEQRVAHLGLVDDGEPYVTPLSYVVLDGDVYYRTGPGRRHDALASDPRVCVEVTRNDDAGWVSVIFWGEARVVDDPARHAQVVEALLDKYHDEPLIGIARPGELRSEDHIVMAITPERMTGRSSGGGWSSATRPGRL